MCCSQAFPGGSRARLSASRLQSLRTRRAHASRCSQNENSKNKASKSMLSVYFRVVQTSPPSEAGIFSSSQKETPVRQSLCVPPQPGQALVYSWISGLASCGRLCKWNQTLWPCATGPCPSICDSQGLSMSQRVPACPPFLRLTTFRCRDGPALQLKGTWGGLSGPPGHMAPSARLLHHSPQSHPLPRVPV